MENKLSMKMSVVIVLGLIILAFWGRFNAMKNGTLEKPVPVVNSFEECAELYPVMESYPEQCATTDGKHFTNPEQIVSGQKMLADGIIKGRVVVSESLPIGAEVVAYSFENWEEKERVGINPDGTFDMYIAEGAYYIIVEPGMEREKAEAIFIQQEQTVILDFTI